MMKLWDSNLLIDSYRVLFDRVMHTKFRGVAVIKRSYIDLFLLYLRFISFSLSINIKH